jgi:hypothetical protein
MLDLQLGAWMQWLLRHFSIIQILSPSHCLRIIVHKQTIYVEWNFTFYASMGKMRTKASIQSIQILDDDNVASITFFV